MVAAAGTWIRYATELTRSRYVCWWLHLVIAENLTDLTVVRHNSGITIDGNLVRAECRCGLR